MTETKEVEQRTTLSPLLVVLERVWERLQAYNEDIPNVVLVIGSGGRRATTLLGHFAKNSWGEGEDELHEVLIVAESLSRTAVEIFNTLIHEACHGIANSRGVKDVSNTRHNKKFAAIADELGLEPPESPHPRLGFSDVRMTPALEEYFAEEIGWIDEELKLCRKIFIKESTTKKTTWVAECECFRKLRLPKKTIIDPEALDIVCKSCGTDFSLPDEEIESYRES